MMLRILGIMFCAVCLWPGSVSAQATSTFTIQMFGATDTDAPSTPTILAATPVTASQVDLSWSTSTDNFLVFGYVVFRDGIAIATTTAQAFSDTGLSASTTYSYEVVAFDGVPNYSSSSAAVVATTPDIIIPVTEDSAAAEEGTVARVVLDSFSVSAGVATATVEATTRRVARLEVRIGLTNAYEQFYIVGNTYQLDHQVLINDLQSDTTYYYEVVGYTASGAQTLLRQGSFRTDSTVVPLPPSNVSNLLATQVQDGVELRYSLPADFPADGIVRVVRNHLGFPGFLSDGLVVYEGTATTVRDDTAFSIHDTAFYTVFVIDPNGLVSSGAVVVAQDTRFDDVTPIGSTATTDPTPATGDVPLPDPLDVVATTTAILVPVPTSSPVIPVDGFPALGDFMIKQGTTQFSFSSTTIILSGDEPFQVAVPSEQITGDFKTIVATLSDPRGSGKVFSFLLRLDAEQAVYGAMIAPLGVSGVSELTVEVFDYDTKVIGRYSTGVQFVAEGTASTTLEVWYWRLQSWLWAALLFVPIVLLGWLWLIFRKRSPADEDNV